MASCMFGRTTQQYLCERAFHHQYQLCCSPCTLAAQMASMLFRPEWTAWGSPSAGVALDSAPAGSADNSVEPLKLGLGRASEGSDKVPGSRSPGTRVSRRLRLPWLVRPIEV